MEEMKFEVGTVVAEINKESPPPMTITRVGPSGMVECTWWSYDECDYRKDVFYTGDLYVV